jgi:hypothetical protein
MCISYVPYKIRKSYCSITCRAPETSRTYGTHRTYGTPGTLGTSDFLSI